MNIGIIGQGFVGSAIREGLKAYHEVRAYDIEKDKCYNMDSDLTIDNLLEKSEIIFVCLPTPMRKDGSCDTRILESAIEDMYRIWKKNNPEPRHADFLSRQQSKKVLVIKSTVIPGTTEKIASKYPGFDICFSPEFLTEANSFEDFKNQTRIIIGGAGAKAVKRMFRKPFPDIPIIITHSKTAEMVKYFTNCFLATKVTFANQMYDICQSSDIDYDKVCEYALYDGRIGKSHLAVPGPDNDRGFGGHCFPKDLAAMINFAMENKTPFLASFLQDVQNYNELIRTNKDWKAMKGRAVSDD